MAFVTRTITGDLRQMFGDSIDITTVRGYAETNLETGQAMIFDLANDRQYLGSGRLTINQDGTWELTEIPDWNNSEADQNPTGVQVQVRFEYVDPIAALGAPNARRTKQWSSGYLEVDHDGTIGEFVAQQLAPADWRSDFMDDMETIRDDAQAAADQAGTISGLTGEDDAVGFLVDTPSVTQVAVDNRFAEGIAGISLGLDQAAVLDQIANYLVDPTMPPEPIALGAMSGDSRLAGVTHAAVSTDGNYLYATVRASGTFYIVDATDRQNLQIIATITNGVGGANIPSPGRMAVYGNYAVITCSTRVAVVNCTDPLNPTVASTGTDSAMANNGLNRIVLSADGNTAFITVSSGSRVTNVDITNKAAPAYTTGHTLQDTTNLAGATGLAVLSPTRLAVACSTRKAVVVLDTSNLASMGINHQLLDTTILDGAAQMARNGRYLMVLTGQGRAVCVDALDPSALALRGARLAASTIQGIQAVHGIGSMLYATTVSNGIGGVIRVDFSNPDDPVLPTSPRTLEKEEMFGATAPTISGNGRLVVITGPDLGRLNIYGRVSTGDVHKRVTISNLGDSLMAHWGSGATRQSTRSPLVFANMLNGQKYVMKHNGGTSGQTAQQIADRLYVDLLAIRATVVIICAGTNNLASSDTAEQILELNRRMVGAAVDAGGLVVWSTIPARTFSSDPGGLYRAKLNAINTAIRAEANALTASGENVVLWDWFTAWDDGTGVPQTGYTYDGLHEAAKGAQAAAPSLDAALTALLAGRYIATGRRLKSANLVPDATFSGTGGTIGSGASGVAADNCTVTNCTASKPTSSTMQVDVAASTTATIAQTVTVTAGENLVLDITHDEGTFTNVTRINAKLESGAAAVYDRNPAYAASGGAVLDDSVTNPIPSAGTNAAPITTEPQTWQLVVPSGQTTATWTVTVTTGASGAARLIFKTRRVSSAFAA